MREFLLPFRELVVYSKKDGHELAHVALLRFGRDELAVYAKIDVVEYHRVLKVHEAAAETVRQMVLEPGLVGLHNERQVRYCSNEFGACILRERSNKRSVHVSLGASVCSFHPSSEEPS